MLQRLTARATVTVTVSAAATPTPTPHARRNPDSDTDACTDTNAGRNAGPNTRPDSDTKPRRHRRLHAVLRAAATADGSTIPDDVLCPYQVFEPDGSTVTFWDCNDYYQFAILSVTAPIAPNGLATAISYPTQYMDHCGQTGSPRDACSIWSIGQLSTWGDWADPGLNTDASGNLLYGYGSFYYADPKGGFSERAVGGQPKTRERTISASASRPAVMPSKCPARKRRTVQSTPASTPAPSPATTSSASSERRCR